MKNDLDRPLRTSKRMREAGFFRDPERMSNQDLIDECIALGATVLLGKPNLDPAEYHIVAEDILACIEMSSADRDTIEGLMENCYDMVSVLGGGVEGGEAPHLK